MKLKILIYGEDINWSMARIKQQDDEALVKFLKDTKTLRDSALEND